MSWMGFGCIAIYPKLFVTFFAPFYGQSQHIYYISQIQGAHSLPTAAATASGRIIQHTLHILKAAPLTFWRWKNKGCCQRTFQNVCQLLCWQYQVKSCCCSTYRKSFTQNVDRLSVYKQRQTHVSAQTEITILVKYLRTILLKPFSNVLLVTESRAAIQYKWLSWRHKSTIEG